MEIGGDWGGEGSRINKMKNKITSNKQISTDSFTIKM